MHMVYAYKHKVPWHTSLMLPILRGYLKKINGVLLLESFCCIALHLPLGCKRRELDSWRQFNQPCCLFLNLVIYKPTSGNGPPFNQYTWVLVSYILNETQIWCSFFFFFFFLKSILELFYVRSFLFTTLLILLYDGLYIMITAFVWI